MISLKVLNLDSRDINIFFTADHSKGAFSRKFTRTSLAVKNELLLAFKIKALLTVSSVAQKND
jgi:hypothetical protein